MSLVNTLSAWQWAILAAIPPLIVLLYFLKLRRMPVTVPSTYLWRKAVEDLHVNSIWQRLRRNLLLLLQLLAVLAILLACLRPGFRGQETLGERSILMIDNSGSMQATDVPVSRLAQAKDEANRLIEAMGRTDVAMVIAFSDRADVRQGFTADKKKLRAAVAAILPTSRTTDLNEALRAASGLANPGRTSQVEDLNDIQVAEAMPATVYILSDGAFGTPQLDLGNLTAEYLPIGTGTPFNVALLAFTVERNTERSGQIEAFARLQNFGTRAAAFTASLTLDGQLVDATDISLAAGGSSGVSFELGDVSEGRLRLELEVDDDFQLDNVAYAGLDPPRQLEVVLVSRGSTALETALATQQAQSLASVRLVEPSALAKPEQQQLAASGSIDLYIYDQCSPAVMPAANTLFVGAMPPDQRWGATDPHGPLFVIDTNRAHPILQFVDMGTVRIVEGQTLELPPGGTELLRTDAGILMGVATSGAYQDAVIAMPLVKRTAEGDIPNTDWPIKRSFPVFVFNALEYLGGAVSTAGSKTVQPGQAAVLSLANRFERVQVTNPLGQQAALDRSGGPQLIYTQTETLGFYEAKPPEVDRLLQLFTVNLFSEQESNLAVAPDVQIGAQRVAANLASKDIVRLEYWRWLLAFALLVLSVEWYLYQRRIAI
ncbi:MAG: VWA domain-containing protein [Planctomycetales bacterium]|nr:VWA domain-containing protein [Planctomycetales bacterium]